MIGKIPKPGKSFGGCIRYNMLKPEAEVLLAEGVRYAQVSQATADFNMQRKMNPGLGQAVGHMILSFSPNEVEKITNELMVTIAGEYLQKMKIGETQLLMIRHSDRAHPHLHIIYNRVDNNGKTITDNFQWRRNINVCKELTKEHNLYLAKGKDAVNRQQLKGSDQVKYLIYDAIRSQVKNVYSIGELERRLQLKGIRTVYKLKSGSNEIQGISFGKDGCMFKGSEIDRNFSYSKLSGTIERQQAELKMAHEDHRQMVAELRQITQMHKPGASMLDTLLRQEDIGPIPYITPDEDDGKYRKKKKKQEISR
ncbi:relaxase/mobilization nuclease domain-containing protein [Mucilaginibacter sp. McL0603]|uniref:relaxase/mobilization nuclease domain-containing protein n=1 Tax=Mucilaginibacter sp. McL0603 TaxID=3415670 RepID=UPI003CF7D09D